jgi:hypothetical protein
MARSRGGQDPTREGPGGSTNEGKLAKISELGSDRAGGEDMQPSADRADEKPPQRPGRS